MPSSSMSISASINSKSESSTGSLFLKAILDTINSSWCGYRVLCCMVIAEMLQRDYLSDPSSPDGNNVPNDAAFTTLVDKSDLYHSSVLADTLLIN